MILKIPGLEIELKNILSNANSLKLVSYMTQEPQISKVEDTQPEICEEDMNEL